MSSSAHSSLLHSEAVCFRRAIPHRALISIRRRAESCISIHCLSKPGINTRGKCAHFDTKRRCRDRILQSDDRVRKQGICHGTRDASMVVGGTVSTSLDLRQAGSIHKVWAVADQEYTQPQNRPYHSRPDSVDKISLRKRQPLRRLSSTNLPISAHSL